MENKTFQISYDSFISHIYKFKLKLSDFNAYQIGQFKLKFPNDVLNLSKVDGVDFSKDFIHNFCNLLDHYVKLKSKEKIFIEDCLFVKISELLDFFKVPNFKFSFDNGQQATFSKEQLKLFGDFLNESSIAIENGTNILSSINNTQNTSTNNTRLTRSLENIEPSAFVNFEDSKDFISSLFNKKFRYENHLKIIETHLANGTTPSNLFYCKFPLPQLWDDAEYINEYNNLIVNFQKDSLNLSKKHFEKRSNIINNKMTAISDNLKEKNSNLDIVSKIANLHDKSLDSLKDNFRNSNERALRAKAIPFKVGQKRKKLRFSQNNETIEISPNESFQNSSHNNSSISSNSTSRSILRNNNQRNNKRHRSSSSNRSFNNSSNRNNNYSRNRSTNKTTTHRNNDNRQTRHTNHSNSYNRNSSSFNPYQRQTN
jgi:hypothetical protein